MSRNERLARLTKAWAFAISGIACGSAGCAATGGALQVPPTATVAFPGAEGAGALSVGGRGGRVLRVTSLDDSGPGSLRAAVEAQGPRTIIFDIGGTIRLQRPLVIRNPRITIAGQTAPGGGVTVRDHVLEIAADDVVIRYVRARLGDVSRVESDAFTISRGRRIIVDHVSASWSVDETLSAGSAYRTPADDLRDVTVQWSIISESLRRSVHAKGDHGYGSLLRGSRGARMTFHHNLWAHHQTRMPRPGNYLRPIADPDGAYYDFRSNVFYNWAGTRPGYNADSGDKASHVRYNFIDNAYLRGPNSRGALAFEEENPIARAYFAGNSMDGVIPADPWSLVTGRSDPDYRLQQPVEMPIVSPDPAPRALARVLAQAGASRHRDAVDRRVVESVRARTGGLIDSQQEVGGWPELVSGRPWRDGDGDGMPDAWERRNRFDPDDPSDGHADRDGDGFTNLEAWLAELAADGDH